MLLIAIAGGAAFALDAAPEAALEASAGSSPALAPSAAPDASPESVNCTFAAGVPGRSFTFPTCGSHSGSAITARIPQLSSAIRQDPVARAIGSVSPLARAGPAYRLTVYTPMRMPPRSG